MSSASTCRAEGEDFVPLLFGIRLGDARRFQDAAHRHLVVKRRDAWFEKAGNGRGAGRVGRAGERDVSLAGKQSGGWIESDPARAGQIDFGPGVKIGEIGSGAGWAFERLYVRR